MKIPRDAGGEELVSALAKFDYKTTRQSGSHVRLTSSIKGEEHHITIPRHKPLKVGTLSRILKDVALYLGMELSQLTRELFK
jgi:predicted RNA binding protein YcfA (HicA-like mRNA interferase family)